MASRTGRLIGAARGSANAKSVRGRQRRLERAHLGGHQALRAVAETREQRIAGLEFGELHDLRPGPRGRSGRLLSMDVHTDRGIFSIGKELKIRRALSESHLYSAAIWFEWKGDTLVIHGKGWGHGVGMCQLGAARMALAGHSCESILSHYYPGSALLRLQV